MKRLVFHLSTYEGVRLFHIAVKIDKVFRKLAGYAANDLFSHERYLTLLDEVEESIESYRQLLNRAFQFFEKRIPKEVTSGMPYAARRYRGIMSNQKLTGTRVEARISTEIGFEVFKWAKHTDVCIRLVQEYGLKNLEAVHALKTAINNQIDLLKLTQTDCTKELLKTRGPLKTDNSLEREKRRIQKNKRAQYA